MKIYFIVASALLFFPSCKKTDFVNDEVIPERIVISQEQYSLTIGRTAQISPVYFNRYGIMEAVNLTYTSSIPTIATVDNTGRVTALKVGQTIIQPSFQSFLGPVINVNVVSDPTAVAIVSITSPTNMLSVSSSTQLSVEARNLDGTIITGMPVEWFSENPLMATVNSSGLVTAIGSGIVAIHAKINGVKSNSIIFTISAPFKRGAFVRAGGYQASGNARLGVEGGKLILRLEDDFVTSFALGTFIYLANSTNASAVRSGGLEIAQITTNGAHTFDVSAVNNSVNINTYRYVIILCKPATVTFGFADLK